MFFKAERQSFDDGFYHRILFACPEPSQYDADCLEENHKPLISLNSIFLFIKMYHENKKCYKFSQESMILVKNMFNKYQKYVTMANKFDFFWGNYSAIIIIYYFINVPS